MKNKLVEDYLNKSAIRIKALYFYLEHQDYADTVREAQEVVELLLKSAEFIFDVVKRGLNGGNK